MIYNDPSYAELILNGDPEYIQVRGKESPV
ncbi:MAG: hypothetical protein ACLRNW_21060 [Neglectibacter sp.]